MNRKHLGPEGLIVSCRENYIYLLGGDLRGPFYAAISFLEVELGVFNPEKNTLEIIKRQPVINVKSRIENPAFELRMLIYKNVYDSFFASFNKLNTIHLYPLVYSDIGGSTILYQDCGLGHTANCIVPISKYYLTNPEYFSKVPGSNLSNYYGQLCLTNTAVFRLVLKYVRNLMVNFPKSELFNFSPNDTRFTCTCDNCSAINLVEGSKSGTLVRFMNRLVDSLEFEYPSLKYVTLSYFDTDFGTKSKLNNKTSLLLSADTSSWIHPFEPISKDVNFNKRLESWKKCTNNIWIWDYTMDFNDYYNLYPDIDIIADNLRFYKSKGVKGVFLESHSETDFVEEPTLRSYIFSKLLWDPRLDWNILRTHFVANYYGKAAKEINKYYNIIYKESKEKRIAPYILNIKNSTLKEIIKVVDNINKLKLNAPYSERVSDFVGPIIYSIIRHRNEDLTPTTYYNYSRQLKSIFISRKVDRLNNGMAKPETFIKTHLIRSKSFLVTNANKSLKEINSFTVDASKFIIANGDGEASIYPYIVEDNDTKSGLAVNLPNKSGDWLVRYEPDKRFVNDYKHTKIILRIKVKKLSNTGWGMYFNVYDRENKKYILEEHIPNSELSETYKNYEFSVILKLKIS
ncbi:MAG: DUF4838 domain-containing protein [Saprospiraceae bacterium]|nr:DUF4838 domain-containing protein [Candidatus Brachybacter algidus]